MSLIREKSKINMDAASLLQLSKLYAPSVHCSYYGCFQLMKHILSAKVGVTYQQQDEEIKRTKALTHTYVINKLITSTHIKDPLQRRDLRTSINQLKDLRVESDYKNLVIEQPLADKAYKTAVDIIDQLKSNFRL